MNRMVLSLPHKTRLNQSEGKRQANRHAGTTNGTLAQKQLIGLGRILEALKDILRHFGDLF